jgi:hypothetical protein
MHPQLPNNQYQTTGQFTGPWAGTSAQPFASGVEGAGSGSNYQFPQFPEHFSPPQPPIQQTQTIPANQPRPQVFHPWNTHEAPAQPSSVNPPPSLEQSWNIATTVPPFTTHYPRSPAPYTPQQLGNEYAGGAASSCGPSGENINWMEPSPPRSLPNSAPPSSLGSSAPPSISSQSLHTAASRSSAFHQVGSRVPRRERSSASRPPTYKTPRSQASGPTYRSAPSSSKHRQELATPADISAELATPADNSAEPAALSDNMIWKNMRDYNGELLIYLYFVRYDTPRLGDIWNVARDRYRACQEQAAAAGLPGSYFFLPTMPLLTADRHSRFTGAPTYFSESKCNPQRHGGSW